MQALQKGATFLRQSDGRSSSRRNIRHVVKASKTADGPKIAIVGVTGAVGQEFLKVR
jgi:aspartate-semialdehyde dehydrogenase